MGRQGDGALQRCTVPEAARLLGISERGVRDKIERGQLAAEKEGKRWIITLPAVVTTAPGAAPCGSAGGSDAVAGEPVDVPYRVTPAEVERVIERTGAKYVSDLQAMYRTIGEDYRRLYEAQLAARDAQLAAKDEVIAELRRRAEVAERAVGLSHVEPAPAGAGLFAGLRRRLRWVH